MNILDKPQVTTTKKLPCFYYTKCKNMVEMTENEYEMRHRYADPPLCEECTNKILKNEKNI